MTVEKHNTLCESKWVQARATLTLREFIPDRAIPKEIIADIARRESRRRDALWQLDVFQAGHGFISRIPMTSSFICTTKIKAIK